MLDKIKLFIFIHHESLVKKTGILLGAAMGIALVALGTAKEDEELEDEEE